ncbi:hypothetical protein CXF68_02805 [Tenacibaculum sp. Bg11-29]|uniref:hypothetical protein n=1 Tax=Tenacibaculum sp. Bg11-29 TaxID=2058306 RepID=UPI000C34774D|nr:hypothetical protein [Tenacibaculum sp. Bg11-29]PKH49688.1 hypothetical protein CXF68_02805 [Tenacibaculum sp. Bg11-29]
MKKILFLLLAICILGCVSYPKEPPYLVGKEGFTMKHIKKVAPYRHSSNVPRKNGYSLYNIPSKINNLIEREKWDIIEEKYKAELFYVMNKKGNDIYIYRNIIKWHANKEKKILPLAYLFKLLKAEGIAKEDYTVLANVASKKLNTRHVLLLYKGVKHDIILMPDATVITSYPKEQQPYWESQGQFMTDTSKEIIDKWIEENRHNY